MADEPESISKQGPADDRAALLAEVTRLERENRSLSGLIDLASPDVLAELRAVNAELKAKLGEAEKALAIELVDRKTPKDAAGLSESFQVLKAEVLAYCAEKNIEPSLWKKLESL